jgi:LmbE family N-acetylglucosaminyl deacetylase
LLLVTAGEHGSDDPATDPKALAQLRAAEARSAAQQLGLAGVELLAYPDGAVEDSLQLRADLVAALRRWRPEVVFTHDPEHPWPPYLSHRDHRVVGRAVLDAIYPLARDPLAFPELLTRGLMPHRVGSVWLFASSIADQLVEIGTTFERKLAARLEHRSQTIDPAALARSWRARAGEVGAPLGLELAEAFTVLSLT